MKWKIVYGVVVVLLLQLGPLATQGLVVNALLNTAHNRDHSLRRRPGLQLRLQPSHCQPSSLATKSLAKTRLSTLLQSSAKNNDFTDYMLATTSTNTSSLNLNDWISTGISAVYLSQFASLYTQLPGLFGPHGLLPITDRIDSLKPQLWALSLPIFQNLTPEFGMDILCVIGLLLATIQIIDVGRPTILRSGWIGFVIYGVQLICWHDLIVTGGRFLQYQMDTLLLDVTPIVMLGCVFSSRQEQLPQPQMFGYRWLLARLYIGAGSVKLLSCDASWRDLTAVHWHFQSQPLPNSIGTFAYEHIPLNLGLSQALTWSVLVGEMLAPFLFLAPSKIIRQFAFVLNVLLMTGIATFGNFGTLQALLIIVGFALLADDDIVVDVLDDHDDDGSGFSSNKGNKSLLLLPVNIICLGIAGASAFWAIQNIGARCLDTLPIEPLAHDLIALGTVVALLPLLSVALGRLREGGEGRKQSGKRVGGETFTTAIVSLYLVASSVTSLGVNIPFDDFWDQLNIGAQRYGLFAIMTGVGGRPVGVIEGATSSEGPWYPIPLLYQVNDPLGSLPVCFPHFPRLDWTLWFIPNGESGLWIARFFQGITSSDPAILDLIDKTAFSQTFPNETPSIVRVVPRIYNWENSQWQVIEDPKYKDTPALAMYKRGELETLAPSRSSSSMESTWPVTPVIRPLASTIRPEYFIWASFGTCVAARYAIEASMVTTWPDKEN